MEAVGEGLLTVFDTFRPEAMPEGPAGNRETTVAILAGDFTKVSPSSLGRNPPSPIFSPSYG